MGLHTTQMIATVFDGITRHTREGLNFKRRAEEKGWKHAVDERDQGTFDWTSYEPIKANGRKNRTSPLCMDARMATVRVDVPHWAS